MKRFLLVLLAVSWGGCAPEEEPLDQLPLDAWAPPNLSLYGTGTPTAGATYELTVELPAVVSGKPTYFITSSGGQGDNVGVCPAILAGDCLDIGPGQTLYGPVNSVSGFSTYTLDVEDSAAGSTFWAQAVVVHNGRGFATNTLQIDVEDAGGTDGLVTVANCDQSFASGVPDFFQTFFGCVDASVDGDNVTMYTDGLPPHQSGYYAEDHPNYVAFDDRGGTHFQNVGEIAAVDFTLTVPSDPVPKGITITSSLVDNTIDTSDEEYGGGPVGVALNGVFIFAATAAAGDDLSQEQYTFDLYEGHPAGTRYHYHFETPGPLEVLVDRGFSSTSEPGGGEVELYGIMCDGTLVLGCTELDGTGPADGDFDAQNGHVHDISDGGTTYFTNRYHTHVCPDVWPDYIFFPEIAYYDTSTCGETNTGSGPGGGTGSGPGGDGGGPLP